MNCIKCNEGEMKVCIPCATGSEEIDRLRAEVEHFKARYDNAVIGCEAVREELVKAMAENAAMMSNDVAHTCWFCMGHPGHGLQREDMDRLRASNDSIRATADREREEMMKLRAEVAELKEQASMDERVMGEICKARDELLERDAKNLSLLEAENAALREQLKQQMYECVCEKSTCLTCEASKKLLHAS